jgi:hypothetical protein
MTTTNTVIETLPHAWLVECRHSGCPHRFLISKRIGVPVDYRNPDAGTNWTVFTSPAEAQAAGYGAATCAAHRPTR